MNAAAVLRVDIVSDLVCPWCYIGWHRLKRAVAGPLGGRVALDVRWLPFELNPGMPEAGMDRQAYLEAKFGTAGARESQARVAGAARADGLPADLARIARTPSTLRAHRLVALAQRSAGGGAAATALTERLFEDYLARGRDIGDVEVLAEAAEAAAGLARDAARAFLAGDAGTPEVRALEAEAARAGVRGVPFFVIDRRLAVPGAPEPEAMAVAVREALDARGAAPATAAPA